MLLSASMDPIQQQDTGFQAKYFLNHLFRRQAVDRMLIDEENLKEDKSPPNHSPPEQEILTIEQQATKKLDDLVEHSQEPLLKIKTTIPLNPFPDKVIIDINKVNIIFKYFFWSEQIHSVYIKDISDVLVETGFFWSTLTIIDVGFTENSIDVRYLSTKEAIKARKIIQGLIVAHKNGIDLSNSESVGVVDKLEELGKAE